MTQKERLLHALFDRHESRKHRNVKFFRGNGLDVSPEDVCHEANSAFQQCELGLVEARSEFGDRESRVIDVRKIT